MTGTVKATWIYPIKGVHGIEMKERGILADTRFGIRGDRNFAAYRRPDGAPTEWRPKGQFHVCMNREGMAVETSLNEQDVLETYRIDSKRAIQALEEQGLRASEISMVDTGGKWHNADTNKPCVSFLNLASVRDLEQSVGYPIDPRRFRMNVWVEGLEPWAELDYVTEFEQGARFPLHVGDTELHIDDLCERCKAIDQSPTSGEWDKKLVDDLKNHLEKRGYAGSPHRGSHAVMGWLAIPQETGKILSGQRVRLSS